MKTRYKTLGYIIFLISCTLWGLILVIPWLGYSKGQIAAITAGLIIAGEITFYLSILLLGKSFYQKIKSKFMFRKKKGIEKSESEETGSTNLNP